MTPNPNIAKCETCGGRGFHDYDPGDYRDCPDCRPSQPVGEKRDCFAIANYIAAEQVKPFAKAIALAEEMRLRSHTAHLEARVAELERALVHYGRHRSECDHFSVKSNSQCTCGLDAALKEGGK
jgi:hypothetical protein